MSIWTVVFLILNNLCIVVCVLGLIRNAKVDKFRTEIILKIYDIATKSNNLNYSKELVKEFESVTYSQMVFSLKKLKIENFYSKEFIEKINA